MRIQNRKDNNMVKLNYLTISDRFSTRTEVHSLNGNLFRKL